MRHGHLKHLHRREEYIQKDAQPRQLQEDTATLVSVVYVTAAKTFDGPIAGFTTVSPVAPTMNTVAPAPVTTPTSTAQLAVTTVIQDTSTPSSQQAQTDSTSTPSSVSSDLLESVSSLANPSQTASLSQISTSSSVAASPLSSSSSIPVTVESPTQQITSSTSSNSATAEASSPIPTANVAPESSNDSHGLSGGGIAGLTIGILLGIAALIALLAFCYRRKRKTTREGYSETTDEKNPFGDEAGSASGAGSVKPGPSAQSTKAASLAPRLSLRPGSRFLPGMLGGKRTSNISSAPASDPVDNRHALATAPTTTLSEKTPMSNEANNPNNPNNPFGNHAEGANSSTKNVSALPAAQAPTPLNVRPSTSEGAAIAGAGPATGTAPTLAKRQNVPKPLNLQASHSGSHVPPLRDTAVPSPVGSQFSVTSISPSAAASGISVHRIQLDFKPSMDDELELRAGQLVRLLHEYDDGWALCIRLDRSQQGVAPRTCLSTRPVKPRPSGNARGPAPPSMLGAGQQRSASPANHRMPKPTGPAVSPVQRSMSPGPYGGAPQGPKGNDAAGRKRSNSASTTREQQSSSPGPSPLNPTAENPSEGVERVALKKQAVTPLDDKVVTRKPVPGKTA